jgi:hypothetical protein
VTGKGIMFIDYWSRHSKATGGEKTLLTQEQMGQMFDFAIARGANDYMSIQYAPMVDDVRFFDIDYKCGRNWYPLQLGFIAGKLYEWTPTMNGDWQRIVIA